MQHVVQGQAPQTDDEEGSQHQQHHHQQQERKHPLEVLALLDRKLVHARGEAFLFRRLLPPASPERQRQFCQVRVLGLGLEGGGDCCW
jgi:hypothetical protein